MDILKNWRFWLLLFFIIASIAILAFKGVDFGIDFKGGTLFTIEFSQKVTDPDQKARIANTVSQRLDWTGLRDTTVTFFGDEFVLAQLAETNPDTVSRIESLLKKQGNFEATIDGNIIFTGSDIIAINRESTQGYGFRKEGDFVRWYLPFTLKAGPGSASDRFRDLTFHRCTLVSFEQESGKQYECDMTYFFIDRPVESVLIIPSELYNSDKELLLSGDKTHDIQAGLKIEEIILNSGSPYIKIENGILSEEQVTILKELKKSNATALMQPDLNATILNQLKEIGFEIKKIPETSGIPWVWDALGVKTAIALSEDVAHMDVATKEQAQPISSLQITGMANDFKTAQQRLSDLDILLSSGSLPVSVKSISKESISPMLGENFFTTVLWMGLFAIITVSLVVFIRYRIPKITGLLIFFIVSETLITIAMSSLLSKFDLGAVAGIIAAVGTGIDTEIIITDELLRGETSEEATSMVTRIKRALFIVFAAASVSLATMLPIIFFGFGLGKLVGFAITTSMGVLIGVIVTRPVFAELAKIVVENTKIKAQQN
jgi:preprotein translocase subunit SecD